MIGALIGYESIRGQRSRLLFKTKKAAIKVSLVYAKALLGVVSVQIISRVAEGHE